MAAIKVQWKVVKTSGGYGVLKSNSSTTKSTVVKPSSTTNSQHAGSAR